MTKKYKILSLYDGMSCGRVAMDRAGKDVEVYFSSEIDSDAILVAKDNYPSNVNIGNVLDIETKYLPDIDLLIGGSPCQGFSFAGNQLNFNDPRSKLFFEFVRILKELRVKNPKIKFLLENVKMKKEYRDIISEHLGVKEIFIDSSNFSAHKRPRYYWTNIKGPVEMKRTLEGLNLSDILEENAPDNLYLNEKQITRGYIKNSPAKFASGNSCGRVDFSTPKTKKGKCLTVLNIRGSREENHIQDSKGIRLLTRNERERMQTIPDNYTKAVSAEKASKMLGNGWTVDVIAYIFSFLD